MKRGCTSLAYLVATAGVWLATAPVRGSQTVQSAVITGEVHLRQPDGAVVPSVDIQASDPASGIEAGRDLTDRDGRFTLTVAPGRYVVSATRPGFLTAAYGSRRYGLPGAPLVVAAGQHVEAPLVIQRAAAVTGFVRNDRGDPVPEATVDILRAAAPGAGGQRTATEVRTDGDGHYGADGLPPGRYVAAATIDSPFVAAGATSRVRSLAPQFFPGVATEDLAVPLTLAANQEEQVDFGLQSGPLTAVAGSVTPPAGIHLSDDLLVVVTAADGTAPVVGFPHVLGGGKFAMALHPGRYRFDVRVVGWPADDRQAATAHTYYASTVVAVADVATFPCDLRVREAVRVAGSVQGAGSQPARFGIRLVPVDAEMPAIRPVEAAIGADGRFVAEGVAPGRYAVELTDAAPGWVLDGVRFRGQARPEMTIDVEETAAVGDLDVTVAPSTAALSGAVIGGGPTVSSYLLALVGADASGHAGNPRVYLTRADNTGGYLFSHCVAGAYRLLLLNDEDVDPGQLHDNTFLDSLRQNPASIPVALTAGVATTLNVRVAGSPQ